MRRQSFEEYYYKNIHAEGCGCSELVINNYEIERKSGELPGAARNPVAALINRVRLLFRRRVDGR